MKKVFSLFVSFVLCILCYPANILPVVAEDGFTTRKSGAIITLLDNYGISSDEIIYWHYIEEHPFTVIYDPTKENDSGYYENYGTLDYYVETDILICCVCAITDTHEYMYRYSVGQLKEVPFEEYERRTYFSILKTASNPNTGVCIDTDSYSTMYNYRVSNITDAIFYEKTSNNYAVDTSCRLTCLISAVSGEDMLRLFNLGIRRYNEICSNGNYGTDANSQFTWSLLSPDRLFGYWDIDTAFQTYNVPFELESVKKNMRTFDFTFQLTDGIWYNEKSPSWDSIIYQKRYNCESPIKYISGDKIVEGYGYYTLTIFADGSYKWESGGFPNKESIINDIDTSIIVGYTEWYKGDSSVVYNIADIRYSRLFSYRGTDGNFLVDTTNNNALVFHNGDNFYTLPETTYIVIGDETFELNIINPKIGKTKLKITNNKDVESVGSHKYNPDEYAKYDIDGDGQITITDAVKLFRFIAEVSN